MKEWMTDELAWSIRETIIRLDKAVIILEDALNECALIADIGRDSNNKEYSDKTKDEIMDLYAELNWDYKNQIESLSSGLYKMIDENVFDVLQT